MATETNAYDIFQDILVVGPHRSGKTSFLARYLYDTFSTYHIKTIGTVNDVFNRKTIELSNGKTCELKMVETVGGERIGSKDIAYYTRANVVILVVALDDPECQQHARKFTDLTQKRAPESVKIAVVGTKKDLDRVVTFEEISKVVDSLGLPYYEVSSKTGENVNEVFLSIVHNATRGKFKTWNDKAKVIGKKV